MSHDRDEESHSIAASREGPPGICEKPEAAQPDPPGYFLLLYAIAHKISAPLIGKRMWKTCVFGEAEE